IDKLQNSLLSSTQAQQPTLLNAIPKTFQNSQTGRSNLYNFLPPSPLSGPKTDTQLSVTPRRRNHVSVEEITFLKPQKSQSVGEVDVEINDAAPQRDLNAKTAEKFISNPVIVNQGAEIINDDDFFNSLFQASLSQHLAKGTAPATSADSIPRSLALIGTGHESDSMDLFRKGDSQLPLQKTTTPLTELHLEPTFAGKTKATKGSSRKAGTEKKRRTVYVVDSDAGVESENCTDPDTTAKRKAIQRKGSRKQRK
ncbi:hypothetical protein HDU82_008753, partial [Entophlyctis luteolus]